MEHPELDNRFRTGDFDVLCEDHELREEEAFEYAMVDEFQDSSEIQFKLALLLAGTDNVRVVGDWKQSI